MGLRFAASTGVHATAFTLAGITTKSSYAPSQIVNWDELMGAMHDIGRTFGLAVRPYTASARAPFESYLSVMARTGILVSRHGPFLTNSIFLPPGESQSLPGLP